MVKQLAISPHHAHYVMRYVAAQIRNYQGWAQHRLLSHSFQFIFHDFFCPAHSLCPNIPQGQARKSLGWAPHWNYLPGWGLHKQYASLLELRTASMVAILTPTKTELTDLNTKDVDFHCPVLLSDTRWYRILQRSRHCNIGSFSTSDVFTQWHRIVFYTFLVNSSSTDFLAA